LRVSLLARRKGERHWRTPTVTAYTAEGELQAMLRDSPELLPGDDDRRPIVMADEFPVNVGAVDLVGVSVTGSLTVVECKLRANPEIRRNIVGQLFAYGSALWGMTYEDFDERWRHRTDMALADHVAKEATEHEQTFERESFVAAVAGNLQAGRFTLVVAVDEITAELQRIIEYLSAHTVGDVDVEALELGYVAEGDLEILVPQAYGLELAERKAATSRTSHQWDEGTFVAALPDDPSVTNTVRALLDWAADRRLRVVGTTTVSPGLAWHLDARGSDYTLFTADARTAGLALYFGSLKNKPVLDDPSRRAALVAALSAHFRIPPERVDKYPTVPLADLADDVALLAFTAAWDDVIEDVRAADARGV
jgi:hypothetical protein